ncbi:MAG TPA: Asp23/Gls24 family envelope stress response protein [Streptosporangiaceae bacterium]|nr:Asp23/Gls24 family envelope stress response protein [Streptosporangiaceae bacterium]
MSASSIQAYDYGRGHRQATSTVPYHERGAEAAPALDPLPQAPVSSQPPAAAAQPLITPAAASAASPPPADPSQPVRQAPAGAGAPQARMGMAPQRPPAEAYGAARPDSYGSARTGAYDRPATGSYSQAATPSAPDDEIMVLAAPASVAEQVTSAGPLPAAVVKGRVQIEDEVVEKVAGLAAVEVTGVADLGGKAARALDGARDHAGLRRSIPGVHARIEDRQVAIHVMIVIEYGAVVMEVAKAVKANVARAVSHMLGLRVAEVNVTVDDVAMPQRPAGTHAAGTHAADHASRGEENSAVTS